MDAHKPDNEALPTPRAFLTSLLTTLFNGPSSSHEPDRSIDTSTSIPKPSTAASTASNVKSEAHGADAPPNPLRSLPPAQKALLSTLHVVFPPPTLLQALDLLDRGLVSRIIWTAKDEGEESHPPREPHITTPTTSTTQQPRLSKDPNPTHQPANPHPPETPPTTSTKHPHSHHQPTNTSTSPREGITIYQVGSSVLPSTHPTRGRPRDHHHAFASSAAGKTYIVHLDAWNCSCAAFAFSAFPYTGSSAGDGPSGWRHLVDFGASTDEDDDDDDGEEGGEDVDSRGRGGGGQEGSRDAVSTTKWESRENRRSETSWRDIDQEWEFGGLSSDGRDLTDTDILGGSGSGGVPICKHLLAALLASRWDVLRGYVQDKRVFGERGREEIAGLVAGG